MGDPNKNNSNRIYKVGDRIVFDCDVMIQQQYFITRGTRATVLAITSYCPTRINIQTDIRNDISFHLCNIDVDSISPLSEE